MFLCPEGQEQHNTTHPHYSDPLPAPAPPPPPSLPRRYQKQFALFTMPACPMAKVQFLFLLLLFFLALMGTKSPASSPTSLLWLPPQQINFPAAPHPGSHGYQVWLHVPISKSPCGSKGQREKKKPLPQPYR